MSATRLIRSRQKYVEFFCPELCNSADFRKKNKTIACPWKICIIVEAEKHFIEIVSLSCFFRNFFMKLLHNDRNAQLFSF